MSAAPRKSRPVRVGDLLGSLLRRQGLNRPAEHRLVFAAWEEVVPETVRSRTRPLSFRGGRLVVRVDSAALYEELLGFRSGEFLRLLNGYLGRHREGGLGIAVRELEFRRN